MKRLLTTLVILAGLFGSAGNVWADDFDKGYAAYEAGDYAEAVKWWRKAAEQGDANAQYNLGVIYDKGKGVTQDSAEAVKWTRKAAEQGHQWAQYDLGVAYDRGKGVTQDDTKAAKWYRRASEQGFADAQYNLGWMYAKGEGVTQDYTEAAKWWRKAAEQGGADAQFNLGLMYAKGEGVTQDDVEAVKWYRKAADQGLAQAQYNLGLMSEKDKGVTQDSAKAVKAEKINPKNQGEPDSKEAVKAVQSALKALGYDSGRIDGDFGPQTKRAYAAWREARGYSGDASKGEVTALMEEADKGGSHMENPGLEIEPKVGVGKEILLYCALGVLALLSSYYLNETQACKIIGVAISTSGSETGFQNAISIPSSAKINLAIWALILGVLGYLVYEFGLVALGIGVLVCFGVGIFTSAIIPKPNSDHFLKRIYASMARRYADYEKTNDTLRANAMSDLLRKVKNTYKERFAHFT